MKSPVLEIIRRDLATFADPGSPVEVSERGASWQQNRRAMELIFTRGDEEFPQLEIRGQTYPYKSFFASEHMGDIAALADSIYQSMSQPSNYVDAPALREGGEEPRPSTDLLTDLSLSSLPFGATRVLFVRGSAGAGKTVALRQLTVQQAEKLALGSSAVLFFYIDAQARALARLDEAVALLLQDLRATFTYRALATLTRLGLVVPIIDGFDELLGTGGYGEAFDSLAKFLARLDGRGSLIASARSTFYEYRDFRTSAQRYEKGRSLNFEIVPVDILPWGPREVASYLSEAKAVSLLDAGDPAQAADKLKERLGNTGDQFLQTPFFVATLVELIKQGTFVAPTQRVVPQIIEHFIVREKEKLRDKQDRAILSEEHHLRFLEMLAEEMWWQGARELDVDTVKIVAELLAEVAEVEPSSRITLVERSPSYAFFESREHEGRRFLGFTHEYYYSFFIGRFLARTVAEGEGLGQVLARARMSSLFGDEFAHATRERGYPSSKLIQSLSNRTVPSLTRELNRSNAGVLFAGLIRVSANALSATDIRNGVFLQEDLSNVALDRTRFIHCEFVRCNLRGVTWTDVSLIDTRLVEPIVDQHTTRLGGVGLKIGEELMGLLRIASGQEVTVYDPVQVREMASAIGIVIPEEETPAKELSAKALDCIELLRRFLRAAARVFYISDDDLKTRGISSNRHWKDLEQLLLEFGLMEYIVIQRQGPKNQVRRLTVLPRELEQGESGKAQSPEISSFWAALRNF